MSNRPQHSDDCVCQSCCSWWEKRGAASRSEQSAPDAADELERQLRSTDSRYRALTRAEAVALIRAYGDRRAQPAAGPPAIESPGPLAALRKIANMEPATYADASRLADVALRESSAERGGEER